MEITKPSLTEFNTQYFVKHSLKEARDFKNKYITIFVNIALLLLFILLFGGLLLYKYKGKLTPQEQKSKAEKEKAYLFQKLNQYAYDKQKENQQLITNLPIM